MTDPNEDKPIFITGKGYVRPKDPIWNPDYSKKNPYLQSDPVINYDFESQEHYKPPKDNLDLPNFRKDLEFLDRAIDKITPPLVYIPPPVEQFHGAHVVGQSDFMGMRYTTLELDNLTAPLFGPKTSTIVTPTPFQGGNDRI